jgi:hypothetical protein
MRKAAAPLPPNGESRPTPLRRVAGQPRPSTTQRAPRGITLHYSRAELVASLKRQRQSVAIPAKGSDAAALSHC